MIKTDKLRKNTKVSFIWSYTELGKKETHFGKIDSFQGGIEKEYRIMTDEKKDSGYNKCYCNIPLKDITII